MPQRALHPCREPGCSTLTERGFCDVHRAVSYAQRDAVRGSSHDRGYGAAWRKLRKAILSKNPLCADPFGIHVEAGVVVVATEADHIIPKHLGGTDAVSNIQPLCEACHEIKTQEFDTPGTSFRYARSKVPITIIAGAPGSGKTSYVKQQAAWGDLIIDLDAIYCALSGLTWYEKPNVLMPFVLAVRDALLRQLSRESSIRHAWFITSEPRDSVLATLASGLGAETIVMDVSPSECVRRISQDERRRDKWQLWQPIIDRWYRRHRAG